MTEQDIDYAEFRAWLEAKQPGERVGSCAASTDCPLARYIYSAGCRVVSVEVGNDTVCIEDFDGDNVVKLPAWAGAFVSQVDQLDFEDPGAYAPITREQALSALGYDMQEVK